MDAMRVGVIAAELEGQRTGVGRYLEGMLRGLASWDHRVEWHLFFQGEAAAVDLAEDHRVVRHHAGDRGGRVLWEQLKLPRELRRHPLDLVLGPAYALPYGLRTPGVVVLHDLSFELLPEEFSPRERWRRRLLARSAARRAERVLTDTAAMAGLVRARYRLPDDRLAVVPLGVELGRFNAVEQEEDARRRAALGVRAPYLLWLGTVLERRQPREVLEAFAGLRGERPELQLVIAGANRMRRPEKIRAWIADLGLTDAVLPLGWVAEDDLAPLYRGAELGLYLSRHEGFGIPPLECLACGRPVVVSAGLALDELWPDYPFRCREASAAGILATARQALADRGRNQAVLAAASRLLADHTWEAASRRLVAELRRVAAP
jgi:glycosyltransferase involved in cell wall biosynthesis